MPKRDRNALLGERSEALAMVKLLDTGAALNSLRSSDYGLDLHMLLPRLREVVRVAEAEVWDMGGHVVHVQVKGTGSATPVDQKVPPDTPDLPPDASLNMHLLQA